MMSEAELCQSIANIICSYRDGEFGVYDAHHVGRWIAQFDESEKMLVLEETNRLLKRNFITKDSLIHFIDVVSKSNNLCGSNKADYWNKASVLSIQIHGNSQNEINQFISAKIYNDFGVENLVNRASDEFIYLDDFIFSGNRVFNDLKNWLENSAPRKCRVCIITMGWYIYGQYNTEKRLKELARALGKDVKFVFFSFEEFRLENRLNSKDLSEVFWPTNIVQNDHEVVSFIGRIGFQPQYRVSNGLKNRVFSRSRREEYEKIMLKYGLKILSFSAQNSPVVQPLGYSTFKGFGFGSTVFSFRNCPNNNPLAFWWGDPSASRLHPFSKWYPLMQRKTYGQ